MENTDNILPDTERATWGDTAYAHIPAEARAILRDNGDLIQRFLASKWGRREAAGARRKNDAG